VIPSFAAADIVLSAAHCNILPPEELLIFVNPFNLNSPSGFFEIIDAEEIVEHPLHNGPARFANDVMLIKLKWPSQNPTIVVNKDPALPVEGEVMTVVGWGTTVRGETAPPPVLQEVDNTHVNNTFCQEQYAEFTITSDMLCAEIDGSCQGDSGGPLIMKGGGTDFDIQYGITSWAIGCADVTYPGKPIKLKMNTAL
jgi:secreted trypsin-like serine protease